MRLGSMLTTTSAKLGTMIPMSQRQLLLDQLDPLEAPEGKGRSLNMVLHASSAACWVANSEEIFVGKKEDERLQ